MRWREGLTRLGLCGCLGGTVGVPTFFAVKKLASNFLSTALDLTGTEAKASLGDVDLTMPIKSVSLGPQAAEAISSGVAWIAVAQATLFISCSVLLLKVLYETCVSHRPIHEENELEEVLLEDLTAQENRVLSV